MSIDPEKKRESYEEHAAMVGMNGDQEVLQLEARQAAERRLVRKLDFRLLPTVVVIFLMNYIDVCCAASVMRPVVLTSAILQRVAITSARLKGLQTDLGLSGMLSLVYEAR